MVRFICFVCGIGFPVRPCSSDGWVNDLKEEALEGEHINEDGYWTEEDDEMLQLVYLGIDAGVRSPLPPSPTSPLLPSLPPLPRGLHDAFSEAAWCHEDREIASISSGGKVRIVLGLLDQTT